MTFKEFTNAVAEKVEERVDKSKRVYLQTIHKNNGVTYQGLIIQDPMTNIHPTIYIDAYYEKYKADMIMDDIIEDIINTYYENRPTVDFDVSTFCEFEKVKERIIIKLVNTEMNRELLEDVPSKQIGDFSIIYNVVVQDFVSEYATILIHNAHINLWGINMEELHEIAMINTTKLLPYSFESLENVFERTLRQFDVMNINNKMYILTNKVKVNGAVTMFYPNLLKKVSDFLEDNLIIIPSSIHEVIIMPEQFFRNTSSVEELNETISMVNEAELNAIEVLSNYAYIFDGKELRILE